MRLIAQEMLPNQPDPWSKEANLKVLPWKTTIPAECIPSMGFTTPQYLNLCPYLLIHSQL
jgi:hypothetical protein